MKTGARIKDAVGAGSWWRHSVCVGLAIVCLGVPSARGMGVAQGSQSPGSSGSGAETRIHLDASNRAHHELQISVQFNDVRAVSDSVLEVRMSRSSPGRYALHEFAKNVYSVSAENGRGESLRVTRANPHQWNVQTEGSDTVNFHYTLFADRVDGTYSAVDRSHLHLNAPATYAWARGLEERPIRLSIDLPESWQVATQLPQAGTSAVFTAENLQALMDAPLEASDLWLKAWPVAASSKSPDREQTVRVALHHQGSEELAEVYAELVAAVVDEQIAIYDDVPHFDHGVYTFLADYLPWASGDGMEHRNSTILSSSSSLEERMTRLMGTVSHEFLHAWNIERIRPKSLEPFDFERANMAGELWFGEGFTSYYDDLVLKRAGVLSFQAYVDGLSSSLGGFLFAPGRNYHSPEEMSHQAPFVDAAAWIDRTNRSNTFISYYTYGAMLGLALDLELRSKFDTPLDRFMQAVWREHGITEIPYTHADLQRVLGSVSSEEFASDFFTRFVHGSETPDYATLLRPAGLVLAPRSDEGWIGGPSLEDTEDGFRIEGSTRVGSPIYKAGLDAGDQITSVDGVQMDAAEFEEQVKAAELGRVFRLAVSSRGEELEVGVTVEANPRLEVRTFELEGVPVTAAERSFREAWLGKKSGRPLTAEKRCPEGGQHYPFEAEFCPRHGVELDPWIEN